MKIVDHPKYNPRLIEYITGMSSHSLSENEMSNFLEFSLRILDHPDEIWQAAFDHQLDRNCRNVLIVMASSPAFILLEELEYAFMGLARTHHGEINHGDFRSALKVLDDSFVRVRKTDTSIYISFANPSVGDFVRNWIAANPNVAIQAIRGSETIGQLVWLEARIRSALGEMLGTRFDEELALAIKELWTKSEFTKSSYLRISDTILPNQDTGAIFEERLEFVCRIMDRSQLLREILSDWFDERLAEVTESWSVSDKLQSGPSKLVAALKKYEMLDSTTFLKAVNAHEAHLEEIEDWQDLFSLRDVDPSGFTQARYEHFKLEFTEWTTTRLIDDVELIFSSEEVISMQDLASEHGLNVEDWMYESAMGEVESRNEEISSDDYDPSPYPDRNKEADSRQSIDLLFSRLRKEG